MALFPYTDSQLILLWYGPARLVADLRVVSLHTVERFV